MLKMNLNHFEASLLFALLASIVLGVVSKRTDKERLMYGLYCFGCFAFAMFALGWLMYIAHG